MSGISSGIGLVSGIDTAQLIEQLIQIDAQPVRALEERVSAIDQKRTAFLELSAQLLSVRNAASGFKNLSFFRRFGTTSSNESIVTARAGETATPGSLSFRVRSLVSNHSVISRGFADPNGSPLGAGSISVEIGNGRVNESTALDALNGGRGVRRGVIEIADKSGAKAEIDLTTAFAVDDVLRAINNNPDINVKAHVTSLGSSGDGSDRIVIEDESGGTGNLVIKDTEGSLAAQDLGIATSTASTSIESHDLIRITDETPLSLLNDGNGVGRQPQGVNQPDLTFNTGGESFNVSLSGTLASQTNTDLRVLNDGQGVRLGVIKITDRAGKSAEVDLSEAQTISDVVTAINAADLDVRASLFNSNLQIRDESSVPDELKQNLKVEDVSGFAAADLGIDQEIDGDSFVSHDLYKVETVGDVLRAINYAPGNNGQFVRASIAANGNAIQLETLGLGTSVEVSGVEGSTAAADLGIADTTVAFGAPVTTRHLVAGLNTVLLDTINGGQGVDKGETTYTDRSGGSATIDFSSANTLQDVIDLINGNESVALEARINDAGTGITLRDTSGGAGAIAIEDVSGSLAQDLNIAVGGAAGAFAGDTVHSGNLQRQYVTHNTKLSDFGLNGVPQGAFRISDSTGATYAVNLPANATTIGGVIGAINTTTPDTIEARINDRGDGIVVVDHGAGGGQLTIEDINGGTTAAALGIAGTAKQGQSQIDGSLEISVDINAGDSLRDVAEKLNAAGAGVTASIVNDGGSLNPYSLSIASNVSGLAGEMIIETGELDLGLTTLTRPRDSVVTIGGGEGSVPVVVRSSTKTLEDALEGVTIDLHSASDEEVTVGVSQNVDGIVDGIQSFIEKYNDLQSKIDTQTRFNPDTFERGPLQGDRTVSQVRGRLTSALTRPFDVDNANFSRLFSVGISIGADNRLEFDEDRFREAYEANPEAVEKLFTQEDTGFGAVMDQTLEVLSRDFDGLIANRNAVLEDQQGLLNDRIDALNIQLDAKRARLESQFVAMERALSNLQAQQNSLGALSQAASGLSL